jgi:hypothetical protein
MRPFQIKLYSVLGLPNQVFAELIIHGRKIGGFCFLDDESMRFAVTWFKRFGWPVSELEVRQPPAKVVDAMASAVALIKQA